MIRLTLFVYLLYLCVGFFCSLDFKQDGAKVKLCNPKYIRDCHVFTGRRSRREPYRTNMSAITLVPYGNNITFFVVMRMKSGGDFKLSARGCDTIKSKWMMEFMNQHSNLPVEKCPFPPGQYSYLNMELPPKNVPLPIADGDYYIKYELYITATKEPVVDVETFLHFDSSAKINRNPNRGNRTRSG